MDPEVPDWDSEAFQERLDALPEAERRALIDAVRAGEQVRERRLAPLAVALAVWWRHQRGMRAARDPLVILVLGFFASLLMLGLALTLGPEIGLAAGLASMTIALLVVSRISARARRTVERAEEVNRRLLDGW
jgi:hypothetical protein